MKARTAGRSRRLGHDEVVVLVLQRAGSPGRTGGHGVDRHAPVGAALRHGRRDGVVRLGLALVAGGLAPPSSRSIRIRVPLPGLRLTIMQSGRPAAAAQRLGTVEAFEARVALAEHDALHAPVAGDQRQAGSQERRLYSPLAGSIRWTPAMSHSPRLAAVRPPMLPTSSTLTRQSAPLQLARAASRDRRSGCR